MVVEKEITVISVTNSFFCGAFIEICFRRSLPCFLAIANLTVVNQIVRPDVYFLSFFSFRMKKPLQCRKRLLNGFVNYLFIILNNVRNPLNVRFFQTVIVNGFLMHIYLQIKFSNPR